ncbi:MAG: RecX family transcriptional regulator [Caldilineaceae bacterium]|nr:RecX family transcriptional regulator [Caldilineaceae bacterium]
MAGAITALKRQQRNRERVSIYIDGAYAFSLPALEAVKLRREQHLSDQEIEELKTLDLRAKAYDKAVRFLAIRPRSVQEVRQKLRQYRTRQKESLAETHIEWVTDKLIQQGYLNDDEFARYWVEQRNRFKPISPRALRYELRQKGIADRTIEMTIESSADPSTAAAQAASSRLQRWRGLDEQTFRKKMAAFLQRRGFSWGIVRDVLDDSWQKMQDEDTEI